MLLLFCGVAGSAELRVNVLGADKPGKVIGYVYGDRQTFAKFTAPVATLTCDPHDGGCLASIPNLMPGKYAIVAFEDLNGNGDLDTNFLGIPVEPYGFSNDAMNPIRSPTFDEAGVELADETKTITIHLH
jgi:uncharacterized protein (DUF2141 family)